MVASLARQAQPEIGVQHVAVEGVRALMDESFKFSKSGKLAPPAGVRASRCVMLNKNYF